MQLKTNNTQKISKETLSKVCLIMSGALCLVGGIGMTQYLTRASSSEYSLTGGSVTLDGNNDGSVAVALKTSVARTYTALQGTWSLHEVVDQGASQTSYLSLSGMTRGGTIAAAYGADNGISAWTPDPGADGMSVVANGEVLTATYTVDKDTPAGTYKVSFSDGIFTYDIGGVDVDEDDTIALDATVTVTRSDSTDNDTNDDVTAGDSGSSNDNASDNNSGSSSNTDDSNSTNNTNDTNDTNDANNANGASSVSDSNSTNSDTEVVAATTVGSDSGGNLGSGPAVPNTGIMTQDGDGDMGSTPTTSLTLLVTAFALFILAMQMRGYKKINFNGA